MRFISVDLQNDFASEGGKYYVPRTSIEFIENVLLPFLRDNEIKVSEIISDYRQPRKGDDRNCCIPGEWGYLSLLPESAVKGRRWIKSMNDPTWIRENIGIPGSIPGEPYQHPEGFDAWLEENLGSPEDAGPVTLFGLTLDRCVLCCAQQLTFRGYKVLYLAEGTDTASGDVSERELMIESPPFTYFGKGIRFSDLVDRF